ncbi:MAG: peptide deformylase [Clostridia bacterium]|nr:peptide deformylase [Clostridia bacterium]MDD4798037.1 peptide deformylase [Clostridia bacterium]
MANLRQIVKVGDPLLREQSVPVQRFNKTLHKLLDDMIFTMKENEGAGLAAPQVGILKQIAVFDMGEGKICEMINPVLLESEGEATDSEGCLSVPGKWGTVKRAERVVVKAQNRDGGFINIKAKGWVARIIQHEMDHLVGRLFIDIAEDVEER